MKFTILTQYYPPEIGAPQTRLANLARHLSSCGHDVTVLTAMPNYPRGRIYPGYGGILREESRDGIRVIRTFVYPAQSARIMPRMISYLSFVASASLVGSFLLEAPDFLMVESPPLFLGIAGLWLRWWKGSKLIFNVSDLWPDSAVELGMIRKDGLAARIAYWLEMTCYRAAWVITGQSKSIVENIRQRFPGRSVFHLSNGVDTTFFSPHRRTDTVRATLGSNESFVAVYAGLHGHAQGLRQILEAARLLGDDSKFSFVLVGDGPEKAGLQTLANKMGLSNVQFLDPKPQVELPAILAAADAILVPLVGPITGAVPSKLYEGMASGRPIVLIASGEPAAIVREYNAGLTVEPNDIQGLVDTLQKLRQDAEVARTFGNNGRIGALHSFDRDRIMKRFTRFLEEYGNAATPSPVAFRNASEFQNHH